MVESGIAPRVSASLQPAAFLLLQVSSVSITVFPINQ